MAPSGKRGSRRRRRRRAISAAPVPAGSCARLLDRTSSLAANCSAEATSSRRLGPGRLHDVLEVVEEQQQAHVTDVYAEIVLRAERARPSRPRGAGHEPAPAIGCSCQCLWHARSLSARR